MTKDPDPGPGDGLGWHPAQTWLATYDAATLERLEFAPAPNSGTAPIYGYAVASDDRHTYLFGNTFDQNLDRQGGWSTGPALGDRDVAGPGAAGSARRRAGVPHGGWMEHRSGGGPPISSRFWAENPMQPRFLGGQWVAATKEDGFWGGDLLIDVAADPWGPWTTVSRVGADPRAGDPLMNTYHAYLMPWLDDGSLVVSLSQNARDMLEDAFPHPERYRLQFLRRPAGAAATHAAAARRPRRRPPPRSPRRGRRATTTRDDDDHDEDRPPRTTTTTTTSTTTTTTTTTTTPPTTPPTTDPCATTTTTTTTPVDDDDHHDDARRRRRRTPARRARPIAPARL